MIHAQSLGIQFDGQWLFREACLEVPRGKSAVLLGPSGSGKSVFLKLLAGLLLPHEGQITIQTDEIGMLFQKNALFDSMTVEENLLFPLRERKGLIGTEAKRKAHEFLHSVGLLASENLYPSEISGGMQKRLGIARALIVEPQVILYDEPTAGLDPITSKMIAQLILDMKGRTRSTVLTVTNDIQRAYQLGDHIYLLARGKLRFGGTPQEVQGTQDASIRQFVFGLRQGPLTSEFG